MKKLFYRIVSAARAKEVFDVGGHVEDNWFNGWTKTYPNQAEIFSNPKIKFRILQEKEKEDTVMSKGSLIGKAPACKAAIWEFKSLPLQIRKR